MIGREAARHAVMAGMRRRLRPALAAALVLGLVPGALMADEPAEDEDGKHFSLLGLELTLGLEEVRQRYPALSVRRVGWQSSFPNLSEQVRPPRAIVGWVAESGDDGDSERLIEFRFTGEGTLYDVQVDVQDPQTDCADRLTGLGNRNGVPDVRAENYRLWRAVAPHQHEILEIHCRPDEGFIARLADPVIKREYLERMERRQQDELEQFGPKRAVPKALRQ